MADARITVIGVSMGGIDALRKLVSGLPGDFPAAVCIVQHTSPQSPGLLADILNRATQLDVVRARDRDALERGRIYVAPPDHHLLVDDGCLRVTKGPKENRFRPAIDPLFRSAAQAFGPRAIGVVLTGLLDDGTSGLAAIKKLGGVAIVQDPADARHPSMPRNALNHVNVDYCVKLADIPGLLSELTSRPAHAAVNISAPAGRLSWRASPAG
jgi:two-component system chemotaxis response regulator CheB